MKYFLLVSDSLFIQILRNAALWAVALPPRGRRYKNRILAFQYDIRSSATSPTIEETITGS